MHNAYRQATPRREHDFAGTGDDIKMPQENTDDKCRT